LILCHRAALLLLLASGVAQAGSRNESAAADSVDDVAAVLRMPGTLQSRVRFDHLTSADGLSNDSVFAILQDRHGFLWFGTQAGLNRYDGYRITQYRHDPTNPKSLPGDFAVLLLEDSRGGIWTPGGRFDPETETFTSLVIPQGISAGRSLGVQAISEDHAGHIWIGVDRGQSVYRFDLETKRLTGFDIGSSLPAGQDNTVVSIYCDPAGILWLGASDGLIRFNPLSGAATHYTDRRANQEPANIRGITQDRAGNFWLAAAGDERNFFDPVRQVLTRRWAAVKRPRNDAPTSSILADRGGVLWLGTTDRLELFDPSTNAFAFLRHNAADRYSISGNEILSVLADRNGDVWVGVKGGGVNHFSPDTLRFGAWRPDPANPRGLSDENVRAIYQDRGGTVWIGTYDGGLNRFDTRTGTFAHFDHDDRNPRSLDDDRVYSIYEDRAGELWVGTARGINRLDRKTGVFTHFKRGPVDAAGSAIPTYSLMEDRRGVFWFGAGEARATLDRRTGAVTPVSEIGGLAMYEDREGNLWFASNHGLMKMDTSGKTRRIPPETPGVSTPHLPQINFIYEGAEGVMWFASETGLLRFDSKGETFKTYTAADGLPDNVVQCILSDQVGNLWLSTNSGISRFNPRDNSFTNFHENDGLQGEQFNRKACVVDSAGIMYFGGLHGFNMFDPRQIPARPREAGRVVLTELRIGGNTVPVGKDSVLRRPVWEMDALHLSPKDQDFSIEFAALNYRGQARTQYRFMLEGLEHQWTQVDSRHRSARYTGIRPGTYRFRAQASSDGKTWSRQEASIGIAVAPPWWMTPSARGAAIVVFCWLLFGAYKLRVRSLRKRELRLRRLVDQRTTELIEARNVAELAKNEAEQANRAKSAFLANMSHDLRTPLNAILGFSTLLWERTDSEEQRRDLQIINRSGQHLLTLINDVLDIAKIEAGRAALEVAPCNVKVLVQDVADMMRIRAAERHLDLVLEEFSGAPVQVCADAAKLREILINLVGNAINYTERGSVTLRFDMRPAS
jgi:signal transduction histidine kinase/streptogramin lyase